MRTIKTALLLLFFFGNYEISGQIKPLKNSNKIGTKKTIVQSIALEEEKINTDDLISENYILNSEMLESIFGENISKGYELQIERVEAIKELKPMLQLNYFSTETNGQEIITATLGLKGKNIFISETPIKTSIINGITTISKFSESIVKKQNYVGHVTLLK